MATLKSVTICSNVSWPVGKNVFQPSFSALNTPNTTSKRWSGGWVVSFSMLVDIRAH